MSGCALARDPACVSLLHNELLARLDLKMRHQREGEARGAHRVCDGRRVLVRVRAGVWAVRAMMFAPKRVVALRTKHNKLTQREVSRKSSQSLL